MQSVLRSFLASGCLELALACDAGARCPRSPSVRSVLCFEL